MKAIKGILYFIIGLSIFFCGFVILYVYKPEAIDSIADFLHPDRDEAVSDFIDSESGLSDLSDMSMEAWPDLTDIATGEVSKADTFEADDGAVADGIETGYIAPSQSEVIVPEKVSGRNGYQPIQSDTQQVEEDVAEQLQNQIGTGFTGDGLEFAAEFYPYYHMLDEKGQHIYRQIYANANAVHQVFAPIEEVTTRQLRDVFSAVYNDHPELFWMETSYSCKYRRNGQCVQIDLKFNQTASDLENARNLFDENAGAILAGAQAYGSSYEKERFIHDSLIDKVSYDLRAEMNQSAYSALVNGQTVCAGYARAFQYLLQQLGIPCYYCTGYAGESHAWNIVSLEDGFYNVDATWDDIDSGTYDYFNKTDADYAGSHIRQELSVYLPPCNGQAYRDLEQNAGEKELRSLIDVGMTESQVISELQSYYMECYDQIIRNGAGRYTFYTVLEGEELLNECYQNYQNDNYRQTYMENAMTAVGASACDMSIEVEELQEKRFLIEHTVYIR